MSSVVSDVGISFRLDSLTLSGFMVIETVPVLAIGFLMGGIFGFLNSRSYGPSVMMSLCLMLYGFVRSMSFSLMPLCDFRSCIHQDPSELQVSSQWLREMLWSKICMSQVSDRPMTVVWWLFSCVCLWILPDCLMVMMG